MRVERYTLFLRRLEVEARIGVHDFERNGAQRVHVSVSIDIDLDRLPGRDHIAAAVDYDWLRDGIKALAARQHFELQETLARAVLVLAASRPEVTGVIVETAKVDVYPDAEAVGCRLEARRPPGSAPIQRTTT